MKKQLTIILIVLLLLGGTTFVIFGRDGITAEDEALQARMEGGDLFEDEVEEADLQEEDFRSRKLTDEEKIALRIRVNEEKHDAMEKTFGCPVKILSELIAEREEEKDEDSDEEASARTATGEEPKQQPAPKQEESKPAPTPEEPKNEPKEEKPGEPQLKAAPSNVEWISVGSNFPSSADVTNSSTLNCSNVNNYFQSKYDSYSKNLTLSLEQKSDTYDKDGYRHYRTRVYYTLRRNEDNALIAREVFSQVYKKEALCPISREYERIVTASTVQQSIEEEVLSKINKARKERGLNALTINRDLRNIARIKSSDMFLDEYFAHESPTYGGLRDMAGYFNRTLRAENIQWASYKRGADTIHQRFMDSEGHMKNRMEGSYTEVGIGIIWTSNGTYVTELFR